MENQEIVVSGWENMVFPVEGALKVLRVETHPDEPSLRIIVVTCIDYDHLKTLPEVVRDHQGVLYGQTGWNSDRNEAYFKNNPEVCHEV